LKSKDILMDIHKTWIIEDWYPLNMDIQPWIFIVYGFT